MADTIIIIGACMAGVGLVAAYFAVLFEMLSGLRVAVKAKDWKAAGRELIFSTIIVGLSLSGAALAINYFTGAQ